MTINGVSPVQSSDRRVTAPRVVGQIAAEENERYFNATLELDSHADTSCVGKAFQVIEYTKKSCNVKPFSDGHREIQGIPIVSAATAYDTPNKETYILVIHQALYLHGHMDHS